MTLHADQFDLQLDRDSDQRVRDLASPDQCDQALAVIDGDVGLILSHIAKDEAERTRPPGWRTKAQNALKYKKRLRAAIISWRLGIAKAAKPDKRKLLLQVIEEELGTDEFMRLISVARSRHPDVFIPEANAS